MSLKKLRYVYDHVDTFEDYDHNDHVDNWKVQVSINEEKGKDNPDVLALNNELKDIVDRMRYVNYGEYYYSYDHNYFVDAWKKQLEIDKMLWGNIEEAQDLLARLEEIVNMMDYIYTGDWYYAILHNLFKDAWDIQMQLNEIPIVIPIIFEWRMYQADLFRSGVNPQEVGKPVRPTLKWKYTYTEIPDRRINGWFVIADIDGDDYKEILGGYYSPSTGEGYFVCLDYKGRLKWKFDEGDAGCPCVADIDNDGEKEVILYARVGAIIVLDKNGNELWRYAVNRTESYFRTTPSVADINNDGYLEIICVRYDPNARISYVVCLDHNGNVLWECMLGMYADPFYIVPAIGDIDNDGYPEVVTIGKPSEAELDANIVIIDHNGNIIKYFAPPDTARGWASVHLSDINNDGYLEIITTLRISKVISGELNPHILRVFDKDGNELWRYEARVENIPAIGDINNDGYPEIVVKTYDYVMCFDKDGNILWSSYFHGDSWDYTAITLVDIDNDGYLEALAVATDRGEVFDQDGSSIASLSTPDSGYTIASPLVPCDIDNDGFVEIIFTSRAGGIACYGF